MTHSQPSSNSAYANMRPGTLSQVKVRVRRKRATFENEESWSSKIERSVELSIACRDLRDADYFSKSDPMVVMSIENKVTKRWQEFGRTETIRDTLNPDFVHKFVIDYFFEEIQNLKFDVYDIDSSSPILSKHDYLGQACCTLGKIVGSPGQRYEASLSRGKRKKGTIIITAEELISSKNVVHMRWSGKKLDKKDFFGKSDPFMVFLRCKEDNSFNVCYKTKVIKRTLNPSWKEINISAQTLCNGDMDRTIKIEVYDWDRDGGHDFIGSFETNLTQLNKGCGTENTYKCINAKKQAKKKKQGHKYKGSGHLILEEFRIQKQATFLDYIHCGTRLSFVVAIDFSSSNGDPLQPDSLHYIERSTPNQYIMAIEAVGGIVQDYDSQLFPAYGFGARVPPDTRVSHLFPITFNNRYPYCEGIEGVVAAYKSCIKKIQLHGPTNFAPVIRHVTSFATKVIDSSQYYVLLMITDGVISDMAATKEAIVEAARLPMSIIIVGVGDANFEAMEELDGDVVRLSYKDEEAERDIVQFVPFRDYAAAGKDDGLSRHRLAKEVLAEIPDQLVDYMKERNLQPMRPQSTSF